MLILSLAAWHAEQYEEPNRPNEWNEHNENHASAFRCIMKPAHAEGKARDEYEQAVNIGERHHHEERVVVCE